MPVFAYKGLNQGGKSVSGTREADNPKTIKAALRKEGVFLTELRESRSRSRTRSTRTFQLNFLKERVSSQELAVTTRQLSTLMAAGIPLVDSLTALIDQVDNESFKAVWADVKQRVNEGAGFGDSLANHPRSFSNLYVSMVRAGETSGALDVVLDRLADFTENQAELRSKVVATMFYPVLMVFVAIAVISILFVFVIPRISKIFEAQKVALPLPTQILIGTSGFVRDFWILFVPLIVGVVIGFRRYIRSEKGRPKWDRIVLRSPIVGSLVRMIAITRFAKTLATLVGSGVPLLKAFDIVKTVVQNHVLAQVIETARDSVKEGESIANPLKRSGEFPPIVTHMIAVGEKSGQLEEMLSHVARSYDVQVNARLQAMTSLLEPVMLVFMGVVVAFIVFSILLPMLQVSSFTS